MTFELDTSGHVLGEHPNLKDANSAYAWRWSDLSPFAQEYTRRLMFTLLDNGGLDDARRLGLTAKELLRFDRLHPDTLAAILRDCEAWLQERDEAWGATRHDWRTAEKGGDFWGSRNGGAWPNFPPLLPYLDDTGRVCLREAA